MVSCLTLASRKDHVITGSWDRTIAVWQLVYEGTRVVGCNYKYDLKAEGAVLCLKTTGDRLVTYSGTGNKLVVLDWSTGEIKRKMNTSHFGVCEFIQSSRCIVGVGLSDYSLRLWDLVEEKEREIKKDQGNIQINNYNASPKIVELEEGLIAIANNSDQNARVNIYEIKI
jgi:WD40 repeat protein